MMPDYASQIASLWIASTICFLVLGAILGVWRGVSFLSVPESKLGKFIMYVVVVLPTVGVVIGRSFELTILGTKIQWWSSLSLLCFYWYRILYLFFVTQAPQPK